MKKLSLYLITFFIGLFMLTAALPADFATQEGDGSQGEHEGMTAEEMTAMEGSEAAIGVQISDFETMIGVLLFGAFGGLIVGGVGSQVLKEKHTPLDYALMGLITATGLIHLFLGFSGDVLLLLNGLGYGALLLALFLPLKFLEPYHSQLTWVLIAYTIITIIGYFATHIGRVDLLGWGTKAIELALLGLVIAQRKMV